jgi:haloacetate dehalogenase
VFEGVTLEYVDVGEVTLRVRHGGDGLPVVLLHGHPRTHTTWHQVAPQLAGSFFVVCPDLRVNGRSTLPAMRRSTPNPPSGAGDVVSLMRHLGHEQFAVVGHDRGSLVAFRTATDHPRAVTRLVMMDGLRSWSISSAATRRSCGPGGTGGFTARPRSRRSGSSTSTPTPGTGLPHRKR